MKNSIDPLIACPACRREWQDHPGIQHTCRLATDLARSLRAVLHYVSPPEYTRDITEQEIYFEEIETARRLVVKAGHFQNLPPEPRP
jgi:hypothetical protein